MDVITYLSFGKSVKAMDAPDFASPIIKAMDASTEVFVRFKHADWYKNLIINCPPSLSKRLSPATAGLVDLQQILGQQIQELVDDPSQLDSLPHRMTIYHALMDKDAYKNGRVPSAGSLYEETQALMFGGSDTTGNALLVTSFHLLKSPTMYKILKAELQTIWPNLENVPSARSLEHLPYLNAVIREGLRLSHGVVAGLLRVVPNQGATICDTFIPGGTIVSCASPFVHLNPEIFADPHEFLPQRWLDDPSLDKWLVSFSKGPRSCLGINLAWLELRMATAAVFRRFDLELDDASPTALQFSDRFLPWFEGPHVKAMMTAVEA
ncbi:MAG: hypothetical protein M1828_005481 [Chrysothrix sp. TS-e1954]|nr:MAG: hypothetical protein M1828_005481 [Chrysothrix sp. TS-e1954]